MGEGGWGGGSQMTGLAKKAEEKVEEVGVGWSNCKFAKSRWSTAKSRWSTAKSRWSTANLQNQGDQLQNQGDQLQNQGDQLQICKIKVINCKIKVINCKFAKSRDCKNSQRVCLAGGRQERGRQRGITRPGYVCLWGGGGGGPEYPEDLPAVLSARISWTTAAIDV